MTMFAVMDLQSSPRSKYPWGMGDHNDAFKVRGAGLESLNPPVTH